MSLDTSPSPRRDGGWSSPGLNTSYEDNQGNRIRSVSPAANGGSGVTWSSAQISSNKVRKGYPSYQSRHQGWFARMGRQASISLPFFAHGGQEDRIDRETEKRQDHRKTGQEGRGFSWRDINRRAGHLLSRRRKYTALLIVGFLALLWIYGSAITHWYRRTSWLGGGSKFVIILGANQGGGVMEWKGAREWAIERDSVKNKKRYAQRWGYNLNIVDLSTKKRYAHEWRESWEKVDILRTSMKKYPKAEWFWWLDLNTFIMEPSYSLQSHIFNDLQRNTYRDINIYNPLKIQHPPNGTSGGLGDPTYANYLDPESLSPNGDGKPESINLIVPQDCGGFNLGSFFVRRSPWTERILDMWWDPVFYEQRHMEWEHKEQDALEYIYTNQPWIRPHVAFVPQRKLNAFPSGACGEDRGLPPGGCRALKIGDDMKECGIQGLHYQEDERDFMVNMAGCEWGRDCWGEMYNFRQLSNKLNRNPWEKFKDGVSDWWTDREKKEKAAKLKAAAEEKQAKERAAQGQLFS